jgi:hypothetical protein
VNVRPDDVTEMVGVPPNQSPTTSTTSSELLGGVKDAVVHGSLDAGANAGVDGSTAIAMAYAKLKSSAFTI